MLSVLLTALAASPVQPTQVEAGPLGFEIYVSPSAQVFYVVDQLSGWSPYCHKHYARWAQRSLPPDELQERLLARHRDLRKKRGWGSGLEQAFESPLPLDEAAQAGQKAGLITADEAKEELGILQHFAPRLQPMLDAEAPRVAAFRDRIAKDLPQRSELFKKLGRFVELDGTLTLPVYLMPEPSGEGSGGGFNGGRLALEVSSGTDPVSTAIHESFHAMLHGREADLGKLVLDTPGLDLTDLDEGLAYALMPGIVRTAPAERDELADDVRQDRKAGKPWSDGYARSHAYGLALRDELNRALERGSSLSAFLPFAGETFREVAPLSAQHGLSRSPLDVEWLGNAGWRLSNGRVVVLVDPYLSRLPASVKVADWEKAVAEAPPPYGDEPLVPDLKAIDAHVARADLILVTHSHPDHLLDVPAIAKKTGAVVVGSESTLNVCRAAGVSPEKLVAVRGGEQLRLGALSVRAIPSLHARLGQAYFDGRVIPKGLRYPLRSRDYAEGGTLAYLLGIDGHRIYLQGSMNFIESELSGVRPDLAIVGAAAVRSRVPAYTSRLLRALGFPAAVFPSHVDVETIPTDRAAADPSLAETFAAFGAEVRAVDPDAQYLTPQHFSPIHVGR